jgi:hypothetical protein
MRNQRRGILLRSWWTEGSKGKVQENGGRERDDKKDNKIKKRRHIRRQVNK